MAYGTGTGFRDNQKRKNAARSYPRMEPGTLQQPQAGGNANQVGAYSPRPPQQPQNAPKPPQTPDDNVIGAADFIGSSSPKPSGRYPGMSPVLQNVYSQEDVSVPPGHTPLPNPSAYGSYQSPGTQNAPMPSQQAPTPPMDDPIVEGQQAREPVTNYYPTQPQGGQQGGGFLGKGSVDAIQSGAAGIENFGGTGGGSGNPVGWQFPALRTPATTETPIGGTEPIDEQQGTPPRYPTTVETTVPPDYSLTDEGAFTELGKLREEELLRGLQTGEFAGVQSAENRAARNSSAREYLANKRAREAAAQAGYEPGSAQFSELLSRARADVDAANLSEEQMINELRRSTFGQYMDRAGGVETERYGRAVGERGFQVGRDDIEYLRSETKRIETKQDAQTAISNIQDQKAKQYLQGLLQTGGPEAVKKAMEEIVANGGTLPEHMRSEDPLQTQIREAEEFVKYMNPQQAGETDEQYNARIAPLIRERVSEIDESIRAGTETGAKDSKERKEAEERYNQVLSGDLSVNEMQTSDWGFLSESQISKLAQSGKVQSFSIEDDPKLTSSDVNLISGFHRLGLKADVEVKRDIDEKDTRGGAGAGNGSVIFVSGRPMRITEYVSEHRDPGLFSNEQRRGVIKGVYLDVPGEEEVQISSTGWGSF